MLILSRFRGIEKVYCVRAQNIRNTVLRRTIVETKIVPKSRVL